MRQSKKISWKDQIDFFLFGWVVNWAFPKYYRPKYHYKKYYKIFLYNVIPQKILGINRNVPWPVHFSSQINGVENIKKGIICDPGDCLGVYIQANNGIEFGSNIEISPGCKIISSNHLASNHSAHDIHEPIRIGNNVMIYSNSVVLPGVQIGNNVVIGAGSVVTKDIPDNCVAVGNPCRVIKENDSYRESFRHQEFNRKIPKEFQTYLNFN